MMCRRRSRVRLMIRGSNGWRRRQGRRRVVSCQDSDSSVNEQDSSAGMQMRWGSATEREDASLKKRDNGSIRRLLTRGIAESAAEGYEPHVALWRSFHHDRLDGSDDCELRNPDYDDEAKMDLLLRFILYLYDMHGKREE